MENASVIWFDQLKGLGEAITESGKTVFLHYRNIVPLENKFQGLEKDQKISVEVENSNAIKIDRLF